ncbi:hypothetical protein MAPG_00826 [Magnaporthiopsis poae ATCC 64411]|uniref:Uncharacterized protein n=1 Tax=Magnaporthiopsis poae (strain ATCC 64411 / 73-15) TaxID=644358 RepID=A0A0C4DM26_MAGP6|nr:hypothetical protein MAPG_00826 [Magnaporthiopsis poae ATCC 64411]
MADHWRILSNRLGELAQRDARILPELHDVELLKPAVPVGAARPLLRPVEKVPFDVWFVIFSSLEYSDALAFTRTCRAFYSLAPSEALVTAEQRHRFYLKVERFRQNDGLLVCFSCARLRPRNRFGDKQKNHRRGKHGLHPAQAMKRHCWDCAAARRLYPETQPLRKDGHLWHLCHQCGIFKLGSQRCLTEDSHETGDGSTAAGNRRGGSGRRIICTPATDWSGSKWWQRRCRACRDFISRGIPQQGAADPSRRWHPLKMCWPCRELTEVGSKCGKCNDEGPEWERMMELQAWREKRTERTDIAADEDMSEPLSLLMVEEEDVLEEAAGEVEPVQTQTSDQLGGTTATTQSKEDKEREAAQGSDHDGGTRRQVVEDQLPEEHAADVVAVFAGRSQSASSHIYHRLQRFLPDGHPLRRRHRPRATWGVISQRLKNALLAR